MAKQQDNGRATANTSRQSFRFSLHGSPSSAIRRNDPMTFAGPVPGVPGAAVRDASNLPEHLPDAQRIDPWTETVPGAVLLTVPGIARFLVQNGTTIGVEPSSGAARGAVELFLHGPV